MSDDEEIDYTPELSPEEIKKLTRTKRSKNPTASHHVPRTFSGSDFLILQAAVKARLPEVNIGGKVFELGYTYAKINKVFYNPKKGYGHTPCGYFQLDKLLAGYDGI